MSSALYSNSRYIIITTNRRLNVVTAFIKKSNNNTSLANSSRKFAVNRSLSCRTLSMHRYFSTQQNESFGRSYIPLMDYPRKYDAGYCEVFKYDTTLQHHFPRIYQDFDFEEFGRGSVEAVLTVSDALSFEDYEGLEGIVTPDAIEVLKGNVSRMSKKQKAEIAMDKENLVFYCPISINIRDDESPKIVEVLMLYHFLQNWRGFQGAPIHTLLAALDNPFYLWNTICCNYRFVRQYGHMDSSWLIDVVNHFRLCEVKE
ncbi:uncharacterized protein LOC124414934 [Diprion similis]|uniref:uncharacterized protein LOC124414934 n=1 Tax=Diprion similis TaxID=362088 RepID=UPI001EF8428D|nr:uncharacterized protein LOC124414934 [Diprion similis]